MVMIIQPLKSLIANELHKIILYVIIFNRRDGNGRTPLHLAVGGENNNIPLIQLY